MFILSTAFIIVIITYYLYYMSVEVPRRGKRGIYEAALLTFITVSVIILYVSIWRITHG